MNNERHFKEIRTREKSKELLYFIKINEGKIHPEVNICSYYEQCTIVLVYMETTGIIIYRNALMYIPWGKSHTRL